MCARSRWVRTVSQICGNWEAPKCEDACGRQMIAAKCSRRAIGKRAIAPELMLSLTSSRSSEMLITETPNVK